MLCPNPIDTVSGGSPPSSCTLTDAFCDGVGFLHAGAGGHDYERLAAKACRHIAVANALFDHRRDLAQRIVAGHVPALVVDLLEMVDIDQHHRVGLLHIFRGETGVISQGVEPGTVEQAGERITLRLLPQGVVLGTQVLVHIHQFAGDVQLLVEGALLLIQEHAQVEKEAGLSRDDLQRLRLRGG